MRDIVCKAREGLNVYFQDVVFALPLLACILVAFVPAALIALIMRPLSYVLDTSKQTEKLRTSLSGLVATAFVFLVSLSTNTLWRESVALSGAIGDMAVQERDLYLLMQQKAPAEADRLLDLLNKHNDLVLQEELREGATVGNPALDDVVSDLTDLVDNLDSDLNQLDRIKSALDDFLFSRDEYLSNLNVPGIPDIMWFAVIALGLFFVALLALQHGSKSRRFTSLVMVGVIFAVGLIQLPMWTLSTFYMDQQMAGDSLDDAATGSQPATITGALIAVALAVGVLVLLVVGTGLWERRRLQIDRQQEVEDDDIVEGEVRDVLIQIRDEMRTERAARAEQSADKTDQGPTNSD